MSKIKTKSSNSAKNWADTKVSIYKNSLETISSSKLSFGALFDKIRSSQILLEQTEKYRKLIQEDISKGTSFRDEKIPLFNLNSQALVENGDESVSKPHIIPFVLHQAYKKSRLELVAKLSLDEFILFQFIGLSEDAVIVGIALEQEYDLEQIQTMLAKHFKEKYNYLNVPRLDLNKKFFIGYDPHLHVGSDCKYFDTNNEISVNPKVNQDDNKAIFWDQDFDKEGKLFVTIRPTQLQRVIAEEGGFIFSDIKYYESENTFFLQEIDKGLQESSKEDVLFFIGDYIRGLNVDPHIKELVMDQLLISTSKYFSDDKLKLGLNKVDIKLLKDTNNTSYHCFNNLVVKVTAKGFETIEYKDFDSYYWRQRKIKHQIEIIDEEKAAECMFNQFLKLLCTKRETVTFEEDRYLALKRSIGYNLHRFKDPINNKVVIFSEDNLSISASGRSGKGLIMKGIAKLMNVIIENGKNFDANGQFSFSRISPTSDILFIDDVQRFFKFDDYFSLISEGITVEKKGIDKKFLDFANSPKIVISSNYNVQGDDGSNLDRRFEMELCSYFSANFKPHEEFKCRFFLEWDKEEWNKFYIFMLSCLKEYLASGCEFPKYNSSIETKKVISKIGERYYHYAKEKLPLNKFISTREDNYEGFLNYYGLDEADKGINGFRDKAKLFADHMGYNFKVKHRSDKRGFVFEHHIIKPDVEVDLFDIDINLSELDDEL